MALRPGIQSGIHAVRCAVVIFGVEERHPSSTDRIHLHRRQYELSWGLRQSTLSLLDLVCLVPEF